MKIVLYHTGIEYPNYLLQCIRKVKQVTTLPLILITDRKEKIDGVELVNTSELIDDRIKQIESSDYFSDKGKGLQYPQGMWRSSCFRLFYLENYLKKTNTINCIHFDNDVLLFIDPISFNIPNTNKILITAVTPTELVFGFSIIPDHNSLTPITSFIFNEIKKGNKKLNIEYNNYPTEMKMMLKKINDFKMLPIIPKEFDTTNTFSEYFTNFNCIFDPATYGQLVDGTWHSTQIKLYPKWTKNKLKDPLVQSSYITPIIRDNKAKIIFKNKNPYLILENNTKLKICNLHIHTKNLEKFI